MPSVRSEPIKRSAELRRGPTRRRVRLALCTTFVTVRDVNSAQQAIWSVFVVMKIKVTVSVLYLGCSTLSKIQSCGSAEVWVS